MEKLSELRVCHLASGDLWAGAEVQVATLLQALNEFADLELSALLMNEGRLAEELAACGIAVTIFDESRFGNFQLLRAVTDHLRHARPHILHSHRYKEHILGAFAAKLSHSPLLIQTYHGLEENLPGWAGRKMKVFDTMNTVVGRTMANGIVGVSAEITDILSQRFPCADVRCIRNGIDLNRVAPTHSRSFMRDKLGIPVDAFVVGVVGRLMPIKGVQYLIEAMVRLREHHGLKRNRLVIVGEGPLRTGLERTVEEQGLLSDVMFLGARPDVYDVMMAFDVLALPSLHEGVPMVLLEAMAIGIPIVASNVGGIPEILKEGTEAFLVPPKDAVALACRLNEYAASPELRDRLSHAARARVKIEFSIQNSAVNMHEMYRAVARSGKC